MNPISTVILFFILQLQARVLGRVYTLFSDLELFYYREISSIQELNINSGIQTF